MRTKIGFTILLLSVLLLIPLLVFATPANTVVTLFSDTNQQGTETYLTLGSYDLPALEALGMVNDSTKSIKVKNGYVAYLYQHFHFNTSPGDEGGFVYRLDQNSNVLPEQYINLISSIKVFSTKDEPTPTPTVTPVPTPTPTPTDPELPPTGNGGTDIPNYMGIILLLCLIVIGVIIVTKEESKK